MSEQVSLPAAKEPQAAGSRLHQRGYPPTCRETAIRAERLPRAPCSPAWSVNRTPGRGNRKKKKGRCPQTPTGRPQLEGARLITLTKLELFELHHTWCGSINVQLSQIKGLRKETTKRAALFTRQNINAYRSPQRALCRRAAEPISRPSCDRQGTEGSPGTTATQEDLTQGLQATTLIKPRRLC